MRHLDGIVFHMNLSERAGVTRVRRRRLDYHDGGSVTAVSPRVACRARQPGVPGLDLAALCVRSARG